MIDRLFRNLFVMGLALNTFEAIAQTGDAQLEHVGITMIGVGAWLWYT